MTRLNHIADTNHAMKSVLEIILYYCRNTSSRANATGSRINLLKHLNPYRPAFKLEAKQFIRQFYNPNKDNYE